MLGHRPEAVAADAYHLVVIEKSNQDGCRDDDVTEDLLPLRGTVSFILTQGGLIPGVGNPVCQLTGGFCLPFPGSVEIVGCSHVAEYDCYAYALSEQRRLEVFLKAKNQP